jgi:hypothetical protein
MFGLGWKAPHNAPSNIPRAARFKDEVSLVSCSRFKDYALPKLFSACTAPYAPYVFEHFAATALHVMDAVLAIAFEDGEVQRIGNETLNL